MTNKTTAERAHENVALLADILNRRPALNTGLAKAYAIWSDEVYDLMGAMAAEPANDSASLPLPGAQEAVAAKPTEDVQAKIGRNEWDHFGGILPTLKAISRGDWYWGANSRCKYIEIRLDTRDGGCILYDRERVRISPAQFAYQAHGVGKMEPWPASNSLLADPQPALSAGWRDISTAPKDGTELLLWREDCGQFIGSYTSADGFPLTQDEIDAMDEETLFTKDWFTQWPDARRLDGSEAPIKWQPLPRAPSMDGESK